MAGGIKIINILKGDKFEEVFDEFKSAEADEVILIFPKNSHIAQDEAHFVSLAGEAQNSGKVVTVMTADGNVRNYSQKYGFKFLASPGKSFDQDDSASLTPVKMAQDQKDNSDDDDQNPIPEKPDTNHVDEAEDKPLEDEGISEAEDELLEEEKEEEEKELNEGEEYEDDGAIAQAAMARYSTKKSRKTPSEKKLENLESIWFKGGKPKEESSGIWPNVKFLRKPKTSAKLNLVMLGATVIALGTVFYLFLGSAQVVLQPRKQPLDFSLAISVSSRTAEVDLQNSQIPGQLLTAQEEVSQDFVATGQKEVAQKARGEITVYNNYSSDQQIFVATTRFESSDGLIFRTPRPITIPGVRTVGGKLIPGTTTVEVLADKPGPTYNIEPGRFSVPGLKGSPRFEGFYAISTKTFTGGAIGLAKIVTENDFNTAKDLVSNQALEKAATMLKSKANHLKIIDPIKNSIVALQSTAEPEQATDGFAIKAKTEAKTVSFSEEDILELIRLYISKDGEMVLLKDSLKLEYKNVKLDLDNETISFNLKVQGVAATKINEEKIVSELLGMKQGNIKDYLLGIDEIESAKVILSPFWVKIVPKDRQDIKVHLMY